MPRIRRQQSLKSDTFIHGSKIKRGVNHPQHFLFCYYSHRWAVENNRQTKRYAGSSCSLRIMCTHACRHIDARTRLERSHNNWCHNSWWPSAPGRIENAFGFDNKLQYCTQFTPTQMMWYLIVHNVNHCNALAHITILPASSTHYTHSLSADTFRPLRMVAHSHGIHAIDIRPNSIDMSNTQCMYVYVYVLCA